MDSDAMPGLAVRTQKEPHDLLPKSRGPVKKGGNLMLKKPSFLVSWWGKCERPDEMAVWLNTHVHNQVQATQAVQEDSFTSS